ncbi:hypothetical protein [Phenylobacterium sp.]|uniref:hypothetical protein n=1 Tax=Phenylobacterium sp. TaxID=1871053 RepID=UPI002F3FF5CC
MNAPADIDDLAMLAEFAQLAMDRARAASRRAEAVEAEGGDPAPHLVAFDRMGRAMRLALSLRRRFAGEARAAAVQRVQARKERLRAALAPAIRIHAPFGDRQELEWALAHRLETEAEAFADLPFDVGVERLSELLGLPAESPTGPPPSPPPLGVANEVRGAGSRGDPVGERGREAVEGVPAAAPGVASENRAPHLHNAAAELLTPDLVACARQIAEQATGPP